jgi:hypothetical protein
MKTLQDLKQFYETELSADLTVLEKKRIKIAMAVVCIGFVIAVIVTFLLLLIFGHKDAAKEPVTFLLPVIIFAFIVYFVDEWIPEKYYTEFKLLIIDRIVHFIDVGLKYDYEACVHESTFITSQIFKTKPDIYKGDDYVSGKIGATKFEFSEINAAYGSHSGKRRTVTLIFKGLFFIADFHKDFSCQTVVLPDNTENLFGTFGQTLQSMNITRGQLIKLDDPEFEKQFVVYGSDQVEARYILSPALMERIVTFKKKANTDIYLSFVGSKVFVAISHSKDLFEPRIFNTLLDFGHIKEYFDDIQLAVGIVEDLNLNTRIWSKE